MKNSLAIVFSALLVASSAYESVAIAADRPVLLVAVHPGTDLDDTAVWTAPASLFAP